ncbi:transcriptional repressor NrdR [Candidatus Gracilibacteria bacterium]|nr:transcriptional repressor NrdR [Candidatus Gracilibacteria bacterium]NUJ98791.1 transcriptional repressor NrdR [Candidatus Gracilibacteria bacterium]
MFCPQCGNPLTKVIDSRINENGTNIRRRRECEKCGRRFTTFEQIELVNINVIKSDNELERYDRQKLEESILIACNKRNVERELITHMLNKLENSWGGIKEISTKEIGKEVLNELKNIDQVAYIRYASVHLKFEDIKDFLEFIQKEFF